MVRYYLPTIWQFSDFSSEIRWFGNIVIKGDIPNRLLMEQDQENIADVVYSSNQVPEYLLL